MTEQESNQSAAERPAKPAPMDSLWNEPQERASDEPLLNVDVTGFEGPLDLLLHLARNQKVDLTRISVLALAEQYLVYIEQVRELRLEIAADYLVMAAWLAFLKSKLLIPKQADDSESGEDLAEVLQFRLRRLEAMRDVASRLANRNRLDRDVFKRGMPEAVIIEKRNQYSASLYDLLSAYASQRQRQVNNSVSIEKRFVWSLKDARGMLMNMMGDIGEWAALDRFLIDYLVPPAERATALASSFAVSLEMAREGVVELRQLEPFAPVYLRGKPGAHTAPELASVS